MSIIIKGMEMPKGADQIWIDVWGSQGLLANKIVSVEDIIEIPTPHGRLIEVGEIQKRVENQLNGDEITWYQMRELRRYIHEAPTILEAEE